MNPLVRALVVAGVVGAIALPTTAAQTPTADADLDALKTYMVDHVAKMKTATSELRTAATNYYELAEAAGFDYAKLWEDRGDELAPMLEEARQTWAEDAHGNYELIEGMVAGVPSLAYYDVWIDAGPSGEEDAANALDIQVPLPDGRTLDKPGNLFHEVTEPILWGTTTDHIALRVDMDADGADELGEALPEANALRGSIEALDDAAGELQSAIDAWEPNLEDAFTALVVMVPTMGGYFEEWKLSSFVMGEASTESGFVANSRLLDVRGILGGLEVTYDKVEPLVIAADPGLAAQIKTQLTDIVAFVDDLKTREESGTRFTPEQADQFGIELQGRATQLAGQISQAAALIGVEIQGA